jgi:hypothetical protein
MAVDYSSLAATTAASALGTLLAGAIGLRFAAARFRGERAFDRRLEWYERMLRSFVDFALELEVCATIEEQAIERHDGNHPSWSQVQTKHLDVIRVSAEANLYGTDDAVRLVEKAGEAIQRVSNETDAFDSATDHLSMVWALARLLRRVATLIGTGARTHLALGRDAK